MNNILKLFSLLAIVAMMFTSCSPEDFSLGAKDVKTGDLVEGIAYKIEHDATNPNIVYLTSLMGNKYTPLWSHPQGRSQEQKVTLKMPFAGTYEVQFGVETAGGPVYGEKTTFTVDNMYAEFVSDEMWTLISGGAGQEKTWYLDLDAVGTSRFFKAPIYFFTKTYTWDNLHYATGESYIDGYTNENFVWDPTKAITPNLTDGAATWYWEADYAGNSWMCDKADFGTMTFNLKGGANLIADQDAYGLGKSTGTYMLNTEKHSITFSGAYPLHDTSRDADMKSATEFRVLYLTKDAMQIIVDPTGVVYNYISKDYKDNWVPGEVVEPEPTLPDGWQTDISQTVTRSVKWVLSPETPFNWANLDGSLMNAGWTSADKYDSWTGFNASVASSYENFSLTLDSEDKSATYVGIDGATTEGTYTLDDKGYYTFTGISPNFVIGTSVTLKTSDTNQWRITKIEKDASGSIAGMWVGVRDAVKPEYMVYHLIPQLGTVTVDPLKAWKKAFVGKIFKPDVDCFVDWVGFPPEFSGGWTVADANFGGDNYTANSWVWAQDVRTVAESASLAFTLDGSDIKLTLTQKLSGADYTAAGKIAIDPDAAIINIGIPLVDYAGTAASWVGTTNDKSITGSVYDWYFVSHDGSTLANIDEKGFWLGRISANSSVGDEKDEVLLFHYVLAK